MHTSAYLKPSDIVSYHSDVNFLGNLLQMYHQFLEILFQPTTVNIYTLALIIVIIVCVTSNVMHTDGGINVKLCGRFGHFSTVLNASNSL